MSMAAAGNFITKLSFNLHPRLLSLSRLKRSGVRCFTADSSELGFPVRYIPKKRPDANKTQNSDFGDDSTKDIGTPTSSDSHLRGRNTLRKQTNIRNQKGSAGFSRDPEQEFQNMRLRPPAEVVEELQTNNESVQGQLNHSNREISYRSEALDSEYMKVPKENFQELQVYKKGGQGQWCKLNREISFHDGSIDSEYMEASEEVDVEEVQISEEVSQGEKGGSKASRTRQDVEKLAVELLAKRAFTAVELRKKLISKQFPVNIVQSVIHDFLDRGFINDRLYAETFSQSRWTSSSWGPRRIKHALVKKGVSEGDVEKAVKLVFEDGDDIDRNTNIRLSSSSVEKLYVQASKQWHRSQNVPYETRKARVIRWLQYRGFDWGVIGIILKKLESNHPP